LMLACLVM